MSRARSAGDGGLARDLALGVVLALTVVLTAALFLRSPIARELVVPPGADTSAHLWRAKVAAASDLRLLFDAAPLDAQVNPDRVGLPVLASVLSAVGVSPWRLMFVTSALAGCLLAGAAWAFARASGEPRWASPIYAAVVAASVPFVLTARSRLDNALADGMVVAAAAALVLIADGRRAGRVAALLVAGGLLMHWAAGGMFVAVGIAFALFLLPASLDLRRAHGSWRSTPAVRISGALGAGVLAGAALLLATPGANFPHRGTGRHFTSNVTRHLPYYRLPGAAAVAGLAAAVVRAVRERGPFRHATVLLVAWLLPSAAALILYVAGVQLPLMRFLGATIAIPILAAVLLSSLVSWASRARGTLRMVAVAGAGAVVVGAIAASALGAGVLLDGSASSITSEELPVIRAAVTYARQVDAKEVVIVTSHHAGRAFRRMRMLAPPWMIPRIGAFQGTPSDLFERAEAPPQPPPAGLTGVELKAAEISADGVARMRVDGAIALSLDPFEIRFRRLAADPGNRLIADGVLVLGDPAAAPSSEGARVGPIRPLAPPQAGRLALDTALALVLLVAAGVGWSIALVPAAWDVRLTLAPCLGLAGVVVVGTVAGLIGLPLGGGLGVAVAILVAASGGVAAIASERARPDERESASAR